MDITETTLGALANWARDREDVQALILTSTRAIVDARVDAYSDFDVILVVDDVRTMLEEPTWQAEFGEVLIAYWDPLEVDPTTGAERVSSIMNYTNGLKIDFNLWSHQRYADVTAGPSPYPEFDAGYQVIVDKERLTAKLPAPTFTAYIPAKPDEATYLRLITDFLIGVPYVAKGLLRDELLPMKWGLDFDMRFNYLLPLLEWRVECDHDWSMKTGNLGKGLQRHLPPDVSAHLARTFSDATPDANWTALFEMITLFARVAREVAAILGYHYPEELVAAVADHARLMRDGVFADGPLQPE